MAMSDIALRGYISREREGSRIVALYESPRNSKPDSENSDTEDENRSPDGSDVLSQNSNFLGRRKSTSQIVEESVCSPFAKSMFLMLLWILTGVVGLTHCVEKEERLYWVDQAYLMSQILTTVGYGDLPPPTSNIGFLFYGMYVLSACMLVAQVVGNLVSKVVEPKQQEGPERAKSGLEEKVAKLVTPRFVAFVKAFMMWSAFVVSWMVFFMFFPGEERPWGEALYMAVITLTTVGFGDFVPLTEGGKMFATVWMVLGTGAFTMMIGKFGVWTFFLFNKLSVEKLDTKALSKITETPQFKNVANARAKIIEQLLQGFEFAKYAEVSKLYADKISRNDFLMFMILDMGLVDTDMVETLSAHFDLLDVTGEGYIDQEDLAKAMQDEATIKDCAQSARSSRENSPVTYNALTQAKSR